MFEMQKDMYEVSKDIVSVVVEDLFIFKSICELSAKSGKPVVEAKEHGEYSAKGVLNSAGGYELSVTQRYDGIVDEVPVFNVIPLNKSQSDGVFVVNTGMGKDGEWSKESVLKILRGLNQNGLIHQYNELASALY